MGPSSDDGGGQSDILGVEPDGLDRPIFIVGAGRSGTTLLRLVLGAHSEIYSGEEDQLAIVHLYNWYRADPTPQRFVREIMEFHTAAGPLHELWALSDPPALLDRVRAQGADFRMWMREVSRVVLGARAPKATRWCIKTPHYVFHLATVRAAFREPLIIHLVRDGRDVAASFLSGPLRWQIEPPTYEAAAAYWRACGRRGRRDARGGATYALRYESLVEHPEKEVRELCRFVGVQFEDSMLAHHESNKELQLIAGYSRGWHGQTASPMSGARIGRWRKQLTPREVLCFERVAAAELARWGYHLAAGRIGWRDRAAGCLVRWRWSLRDGIGGLRRRLVWWRRARRSRQRADSVNAEA